MDTPIACTLRPEQYDRRRDEVAIIARELRSREAIPGGERLTLDGGVERELRALIAAEAECCPFLRMDLRREGDHLVLDVSGPEEAQPLIADLLAPRSGPPTAR